MLNFKNYTTKKKIRVTALFLCLSLVMVIVICNSLVYFSTNNKTTDDLNQLNHQRYGLLLGTSPLNRYGFENYYFNNRIKAAAQLYHSGKIDYIIASGGDYSNKEKYGCNELTAMRDCLVNRKVPAEKIILDYDGQRTIKSIKNLKNKYHIDTITLISQKFHNERAIYQCRHFGIEAQGYNAKEPRAPIYNVQNHAREYLARVKLILDLIKE